MNQSIYNVEDHTYTFNCPHCEITIQVAENEVNCKIFRCGLFKSTGQPINPHLPKGECDALITANLIYGCGKPFQMSPAIKNSSSLSFLTSSSILPLTYNIIKCDYI